MMKRSSDADHSMSTNGNTIADSNNDAKKARIENTEPSRVLHIRGVPSDAIETEIIQLGMPFGRMSNMLLFRQKNQALLEMADLSMAQAMYNYYSERPPQIRGRTVYVQYSNHQILRTDHPFNQQNVGSQTAIMAADNLLGSDGGSNAGSTSTVLRIIIDNMIYPITLDILHKIFSKYGQVLRIVTFSKNNQFQALLQYSDGISAQTGRQALNGQNIYNGCCTLRVDFSKLASLNVRYNNDKSYDYTNPNLPSGEMDGSAGSQQQYMMDSNQGDGILGAYGGPYPGMSGAAMGVSMVGPGMGATGMGLPSMVTPAGAMSASLMGMGSPLAGATAASASRGLASISGIPGAGIMGMTMGTGMGMGGLGALSAVQGLGGVPSLSGLMGGGQQQQGRASDGTVVIVSNLNQERITPDNVFTLFGSYGTVIRVKILYNKKDTALVQYQEPGMAQNAIVHLDRCPFFGKQIKVSMSKHSSVQLPKEDTHDSWLTKDFTNSPLHRYRNMSNKNFSNVNYPPSETLHLSNIPSSVAEDDLRHLFNEYGTVVAFKFISSDKKMALIQLSSQDEAVAALVALHNYQFQPQHHLRVSFTKSVIN